MMEELKFYYSSIKNEDITIYGDGNQTRSFCYVDDLIEGLINIMDLEENFTGPINLTDRYSFN